MDKGILWRGGLIIVFGLAIWFGYSLSGDMRDGAKARSGKFYDKAIAIYEPIAENGSSIPFWNPQTKAQQEIGHIYAFRDDGQDNWEEAVKWWSRASKGGSVVAQFAIAQAYKSGQGFEESLENAYVWAMVAGDKKSKSQNRYLVDARNSANDLSADQMASAEKAIKACIDSDFVDCPY
ncbi:MAG: sel1 repeat family protein [Rhizobiales bacterium]|nr:sel1 repeat family protein [Hyphomicrobiales bacterium]MBL6769947.1 sel1 repeat family protein [Hyphomicrobiales bacterium]